jgi:hypothetical protein
MAKQMSLQSKLTWTTSFQLSRMLGQQAILMLTRGTMVSSSGA